MLANRLRSVHFRGVLAGTEHADDSGQQLTGFRVDRESSLERTRSFVRSGMRWETSGNARGRYV